MDKKRKVANDRYERKQLDLNYAMYRRRIPAKFHGLMDKYLTTLKQKDKPHD